jgi:hypothetical protein
VWTTDTVATVAAVAQLFAAAFTGLMAKRTHDLAGEKRSMAVATKPMADETRRAAGATAREASATETLAGEGAQRDRRPVLIRPSFAATSKRNPPRGTVGYSEAVTLTNLGRGPAFNCLSVHAVNDAHWCFAPLSGLAGNDERECNAWTGRDAPPEGAVARRSAFYGQRSSASLRGHLWQPSSLPHWLSRARQLAPVRW